MREPKPVLINPLERKNANTTSHIMLSLKPDRLSAKESVLVRTQAAMLRSATAPIGSGFKMSAEMVVMNMIKICHALAVSPAGTSTFHIIDAQTKRIKSVRFFFQIWVIFHSPQFKFLKI